jgi:hypothetical protein
MGDPEFHGIEDQLFDAIVDSPLSSRDQEREHLLGGPEWVPWGNHPRQTAGLEDLDDPRVLNLDED